MLWFQPATMAACCLSHQAITPKALTLRENVPNCSKTTRLSYAEMAKWDHGKLADGDLKAFVAFYTQVGLVKCLNQTAQEEKRNDELPILFQKLPSQGSAAYARKVPVARIYFTASTIGIP